LLPYGCVTVISASTYYCSGKDGTRPEMTKRYAKRSNESITQMLIDRRAKIVDFRGHSEVKKKDVTS
jgi:hypothetical protein